MSNLVLHPRVAPPGHLRIWLGLFDADAAPPRIDWSLDDASATATPVRPLAPVHAHRSRSFAGVFDLPLPPAPRRLHRVTARAAGAAEASLLTRPIPDEVPDDNWLRILLTSCFHQAEDRGGLAARTSRDIPAAERPDLTLLMGDQVYLDLPTLRNFPDDEAKLAARFELDYRKNWEQADGLGDLLDAAPSAGCPDDHEYWNNFPHRSPVIQNSWKASSRETWKRAADQTFDAFQVAAPGKRGEVVEIDVAPLSILVLDQRSQRRDDRAATLTPDGLKRLEAWVDRLISERRFGAVVTGQSLLDPPVGDFKGQVADWLLANYRDYEAVVRALARLAAAGRPVLLLTGDVHWGRVTAIRQGGRLRFYEIVCSPLSLVSTVGADQLKTLGNGLRGLFGRRKRWPRHSDVPDPEPFFAPQVLGKAYRTEVLHKQKGNQLATLALRRAAGALEARVTYYEVHRSPQLPVAVDLGVLREGA